MGAQKALPIEVDPTAERADWTGSPASARVRYIMHQSCRGDRDHFARLVALPRSIVAAIDRGEQEPTPDQMRQISSRIRGYNPHWVKHGEGQPHLTAAAVIKIQAGQGMEADEASTIPDICAHVERLLHECYGGNLDQMARQIGLHRGILDWLLTGNGPMFQPVEPEPMPEPASHPEQKPAPAQSSLDGLIELIDRVRGFGSELGWLSRAGLMPDPDAWVEHWTQQQTPLS